MFPVCGILKIYIVGSLTPREAIDIFFFINTGYKTALLLKSIILFFSFFSFIRYDRVFRYYTQSEEYLDIGLWLSKG